MPPASSSPTRTHLAAPASLVPGASHTRALFVLCAPGIAVVIGAVLVGLGQIAVGLVVALLAIGHIVTSWFLGAPARLAGEIGGRRPDPIADARLINVVEGLRVANGVGSLEIRVLEDDAANAIVLGADARAVLICTSGLLAALDRMELEGAVAHELAHLKRGDSATAGIVTRALGSAAYFSSSTALFAQRLCGADREVGADLDGAAMTRYPPGLYQALGKLAAVDTEPHELSTPLRRLTACCWLVPLREASNGAHRVGEFDLSARVTALAEL